MAADMALLLDTRLVTMAADTARLLDIMAADTALLLVTADLAARLLSHRLPFHPRVVLHPADLLLDQSRLARHIARRSRKQLCVSVQSKWHRVLYNAHQS